ncbi:MAG: hypothetical protein K6F50_00455 [Kiritimatiellae bacterium]|nr:hypothetical protein [Kiritimatiellia bacterium]
MSRPWFPGPGLAAAAFLAAVVSLCGCDRDNRDKAADEPSAPEAEKQVAPEEAETPVAPEVAETPVAPEVAETPVAPEVAETPAPAPKAMPGASTVKERMHDPEYLEKLNQRADGQIPLMKAIAQARQRVEAAKAANPQDPVELAAAEGALRTALENFAAYQKVSQEMVARQMRTPYGPDGKPLNNELNEQNKGN